MVPALKITDVTTGMATAIYVFIDPRVLGRSNRKRDRRVLFLISLLAGSFAGAGAYKAMSNAFVLLISAVGKTVVTFTLVFNNAQNP